MNDYAVNQGGKMERGVRWEATVNQGDFPSFPDTCHVPMLFTPHLIKLIKNIIYCQKKQYWAKCGP